MKVTAVPKVRIAALPWFALTSLVAAVAADSCATDTPTLPRVPAIQSSTLIPLALAKPEGTSGQPVVSAPRLPSTQLIDSDVSNVSSDVLRLRARGLTIPVSSVSAGQLTDTYTQPRPGGTSHEALDILASRGTPVLAVDDGRITKLFLSRPGGITLYQFDPGAEYVYYYAHLDRYAEGIAEGDAVLKGQVIGYVGSTGNARPDAPHLHFAVLRLGPERYWWRGAPINPYLIWRSAKP